MLSSKLLPKIVVVHPYGCWVTGVGLSSKMLPKIMATHPYCSWEQPRVKGVHRACDVSRGRFLWVLSSKKLPKIVVAHPYGCWITAAAEQ